MPKILFFADQHIHPHSNSLEKLERCLECFDWIYQTALNNNVKYVVFLGDLFHKRENINVYAFHQTYKILNKYKEKIKSYYIIGNHDMFYQSSWLINSIDPLDNLVEVISIPKTINIEGIKIDCMPYTNHPSNDLNRYFPFEKRSDILCGHLAVSGAVLNLLYNVKKSDKFDEDLFYHEYDYEKIESVKNDYFNGYKKVFLGHYHTKQNISNSNIYYVGSPMQLSFGEAMDSKGCIIFDTDNYQYEFIENNFSPKYYILPYTEDFSQYNLKNNYLRIVVDDDSSILDIVDYKNKIEEEYNPLSIEITNCNKGKNINNLNKIDGVENFIFNKIELLKKYVQHSIDNEDDIFNEDLLIMIGKEMMIIEE